MERSKRYLAVREKVDRTRFYPVDEAIKLLKECATAKFDESADVAFRLAVDPKKNEHRIRGTVTLPHGTGKTVTVLAFAKGDKLKEAQEAGADYVGGEDLAKKIEEGWLEFDRVVATPRHDGDCQQVGEDLRAAGAYAQPQIGHGHARHRSGGEGAQAGQAGVPPR
jgi:large subunit ribosomal protein L1